MFATIMISQDTLNVCYITMTSQEALNACYITRGCSSGSQMMQAVRETELKMAEACQASSIHTPSTRDAAAAGSDAAAAGGSLRWANSSDRRQSKTDLARAPPVNEKGSDGSISDDTVGCELTAG